MPRYVAGVERGVLPIGDWSTSTTRLKTLAPRSAEKTGWRTFETGDGRPETGKSLSVAKPVALVNSRPVRLDFRCAIAWVAAGWRTSRKSVDFPAPLGP